MKNEIEDILLIGLVATIPLAVIGITIVEIIKLTT